MSAPIVVPTDLDAQFHEWICSGEFRLWRQRTRTPDKPLTWRERKAERQRIKQGHQVKARRRMATYRRLKAAQAGV